VSCHQARKLLLHADSADQPPAAAQEHLAGCAECRAWQERLRRLEQAVRHVPVPQTKARVPFLFDFLTAEECEASAGSTPCDRIDVLAELAESLHQETRDLAHAPDDPELQRIARLFERVVRQDLMTAARQIPLEQRRQAIDRIVEQMTQTWSDVDQLAQTLPSAASASLRLIAKAAQESDNELRALIREREPLRD
jgi:hypothetical protein